MPGDVSHARALGGAWSNADLLARFVVGAGLAASVLFIVVGLHYELQMYGDGSIFSYAVAVQDAWAFHWHNISGRAFSFLYSSLPAQTYVAATGDARGGIVLYGLLHFSAPLLSLAATFAADRSKNWLIFIFACGSTAGICPLIFGFPTEVWMTHALFWPVLAASHFARPGMRGFALVFAGMLALLFTHLGALIFALSILFTLVLRGWRDPAFRRGALAFLAALTIAVAVRTGLPPDDYFAPVRVRAALKVFDIALCKSRMFLLVSIVLVFYGVALASLRRLAPASSDRIAITMVGIALAVYWLCFDRGLFAENRYYMRTVVLLATPALGAFAGLYVVREQVGLSERLSFVTRLMTAFADRSILRVVCGALALLVLVHAVETAKFATAWTQYKAAVRMLATGGGSDPRLGDPRFVSSERIGSDLNRLAWRSTTPYLAVLMAPKLSPSRLVADPTTGYFWLSCRTATENQQANRAVPAAARELIRVYACLHR